MQIRIKSRTQLVKSAADRSFWHDGSSLPVNVVVEVSEPIEVEMPDGKKAKLLPIKGWLNTGYVQCYIEATSQFDVVLVHSNKD